MVQDRISSFRDFCIYFLKKYGSKDKIKEKKRELKSPEIEWKLVRNLEQKVLELVDKFTNIDHSMTLQFIQGHSGWCL